MNATLRHGLRALLILAWLFGCGGDDGEGGGTPVAELPEDLAAGTTLAWNPTITIVDGTRFRYENDAAGSDFTARIDDGTYTYAVEDGVGRLVLSGTGAGDGKLLDELPATVRLSEADGALQVEIAGETYAATVVVPDDEGGAAGDGGSGTDGPGDVPDGATPATVHEDLVGSHELTFGNAQPGAPFEAGETATFVVGEDGTLTVLGMTIGDPYHQTGNTAEIIWNDGELAWALSNNQTGAFNEINVQDAASGAWLGQWADASEFEEPMNEGDIGNDVMFEITGNNDSPMAPAPYEQGTIVTVNWDGAEGLTVEAEGETITPDYLGEEEVPDGPRVYGEEDVVRILAWSDGGETEGHEYRLKLEADDTIAVFEASYFKMANTSKLYGRSSARHP